MADTHEEIGFDAAWGAEITALVERYCAEHRHPGRPPFVVHPAQTWMGGWWGKPNAARPGCYAIYSADGSLLYLGKASLSASIGSRLASHERSRAELFADAGARYVQTIEVNEPFEAPSLEEYLLLNLSPRFNDLGRRKGANKAAQ